MKTTLKKAIWFVMLVPLFGASQEISTYSPSILYDEPGGLFERDSLRSIFIDFEDEDYHSILTESFFDDPSFRLPATVTINGIAHENAGVRYKGNSTFCLPNNNGSEKLPLNIDMNYWVSGQTLMEYKKLKLANAWMDATFIREHVGTEIYQNYVPTPEVNLINVYVQGDYLGLFVNTESINKQFLKKHFDEKNGPLFKCDNAAVFCGDNSGLNAYEPSLQWLGSDSTTYSDTYDLKSPGGWAELLQLMDTLDSNPSELDSILNIDRVLWNFAVNTVICNFDTYNSYYVHNYYMYQTDDGLFQMVPWDFSQSFLNALLAEDIATPIGPNHPTHFDPYNGIDPGMNRPLTSVLFADPFYRKIYNAHIRTVMDEIDLEYVQSRVDYMQNIAAISAAADTYKLFPTSEFTNSVDNDLAFWLWGGYGFGGVMSTYIERRNYLLDHEEIMQVQPLISNVELNIGYITVEVSDANLVELLATTSVYNSKFENFVMVDDGTNGDELAGDGIFTAALPFQPTTSDIKFYIRAQNDLALQLSPEKAEYEFYVYSVDSPSNVAFHSADTNLLSVYPNPTSGIINVDYEGRNTDYILYSTTGKQIQKGVLTEGQVTLDISQIPPNIYFLKVGNQVPKIIKTN